MWGICVWLERRGWEEGKGGRNQGGERRDREVEKQKPKTKDAGIFFVKKRKENWSNFSFWLEKTRKWIERKKLNQF